MDRIALATFIPNESYIENTDANDHGLTQEIIPTQRRYDTIRKEVAAQPVGSLSVVHKFHTNANGDDLILRRQGNTIYVLCQLDPRKKYGYNYGTKNWEEIPPQIIVKNNWIESSQKAISDFSKKFVQDNALFQTLSFIGCARSLGCVIWSLGRGASQQYVCWHIIMGLGSTVVSKLSFKDDKAWQQSLTVACWVGFIGGYLSL